MWGRVLILTQAKMFATINLCSYVVSASYVAIYVHAPIYSHSDHSVYINIDDHAQALLIYR